jgi:hypothetical protein
MSESSDSNKLVYTNKISEEESNNKENENIINCLEQKTTKIPEENEELISFIFYFIFIIFKILTINIFNEQ